MTLDELKEKLSQATSEEEIKELLGEIEESNPDSLKSIIKAKGLNLKEKDGKIEVPVIMTMAKKESDEDYFPGDEDLVKINAISKKKLKADQVMVFDLAAADLLVDRGFEHFSRKALTHMAELAIKNQIPFLANGDYDHQWRQKNIYGVVFDASVKAGRLVYRTYIPIIEKTKDLIECIMTGLYSKLSVGFSIDPMDYICDSCKKSMLTMACPHYPGQMDERGVVVTCTLADVADNYEVSGVAVPMQPEAYIMKNLDEATRDRIIKSLGTPAEKIELKNLFPVYDPEKDEIVGYVQGDGELLGTDLTPIPNQKEAFDTINNGTSSTIKDHSMTVETKTPEELEAEAKALADEAEAAKKAAVEAKKAELEALTKAVEDLKVQLTELGEKKPEVEVKVDASEVEASVKTFSESVEKVMKAVEDQSKAVASIAESVEKLEKTVEAAMVGSMKSVLELISTTKAEAPAERDENASWVNDAFAVK